MEPGEEENIPVKGIQDKLFQYWNEYPEILQKMFHFPSEAIDNKIRENHSERTCSPLPYEQGAASSPPLSDEVL